MSEEGFPRLNRALVAEVAYIARISNHIKYGEPDDRKLARDIALSGPGMHMSEEGLSGIMREGSDPKPDTLRKLARYARTFDPSYSVQRLFRAAGWYDAGDPALENNTEATAQTTAQTRLCAAVSRLSPEHAADVLPVIEALLRAQGEQGPEG